MDFPITQEVKSQSHKIKVYSYGLDAGQAIAVGHTADLHEIVCMEYGSLLLQQSDSLGQNRLTTKKLGHANYTRWP